jgi:hypothetical protein
MNRRCVLALTAMSLMASSCSIGPGSAATTTAPTTLPSATSTSVPWPTGAATKAWNVFVKSFDVVDVSQVSKGECGVRAMLLTEGSLTFYWWDGVRWNDDSSQLAGGKGAMPVKVYSHDFTNDGVIDYFVTYEDDKAKGGPTYGGFFAYPWSGDSHCQWRWMDIDNGTKLTQTIDRPEVNQRNGEVFADGYTSRRWKSYGVYEYQPSSNSFVFREVRKK